MYFLFSLDEYIPLVRPRIPTHFGRETPVHHNEVLANRGKARRLWRMLSKSLSK